MTSLTPIPSRASSMIAVVVVIVQSLIGMPHAVQAQDSSEETRPGEAVVTLRQGQRAPFDGTLFSVRAAARLLADLEFSREACEIETSRRVRLVEANMQLQIDTERARYAALEMRHTELMRIRDEQIQFLLDRNRSPEWYQTNEFWFSMGVVGTVLVVIATGALLASVVN